MVKRNFWVVLTALFVILGCGMTAPAQVATDLAGLEGAWVAPVKPLLGKPIRLVLRIEKGAKGSVEASLDTPEQDTFGLPVEGLIRDGQMLKFQCKLVRASFEGKLSDDGTSLVGNWVQGTSVPVTFTKTDPASLPKPPALEIPAELVGNWSGALSVQAGLELRLVLNIAENAAGVRKASLDSPDQSISGLPITSLNMNEGQLNFELKLLRGSYTGKRTDDGTAFEGTWTQGGRKFPLTLKRTTENTALKRPQMPAPPFPYDAQEVTYENPVAGIKLAGSLTLPKGEGPFPAVLLITGSGAQDRDESLLGHKPFLVLADFLTRRGIAVLRVDDRGVGGSGGDMASSTTADFVTDVQAGINFLKQQPRIDGRKIGLAGHSEGGLIAPIVASKSSDVAFIVLMAGTGLPGIDIIRLQGNLIARGMGADEAALARQRELVDRSYELIRSEPDAKKLDDKLKVMAREWAAGLSEQERKTLEQAGDAGPEAIEVSVTQMATPWFKYFLDLDPRPALQMVRCPVLAIIGEKDLQVPSAANLPEIEKALKAGGNTHYVVKELPGLNHLFQACSTGLPAEYAKIEETINPAALDLIGTWIQDQIGR